MKQNNKTPPTGSTHRLTPKQERFCLKYAETGNASEAYRYAYNTANMKPETINRTAFAMLENHKITARLDELRKENERLSMVRRTDVLKRLKSYFNFDIRKLLEVKNGIVTIKNSSHWDEETAQAVEAIKVGRDGQAEITIVGKQYAINRLCAMCGYDAPTKHSLSLDEMTDAEVEVLAQAIINNSDEV